MFSINLFQQFWRLMFVIKQLNFSNVEKEKERESTAMGGVS